MCGFRFENPIFEMIFFRLMYEFDCCSNRAIQLLDQHKATYGAFNVLEDVEVREGVKKFSCVTSLFAVETGLLFNFS
jgi:glutaredoxin-related protein